MKKRLLSLLFVLVLCVLAALPAFASAEGFVFDLRGALADPDELSEEARTIYEQTGVALYFIVTDDLGGLSSADYATQFAQAHGFYEDNVLLMDDPGAYFIRASGAAQDLLTENDIVAMRDAYKADETYTGGVRAYYSAALTALTQTDRPITETEASEDTPAGVTVPGGEQTSEHSNRVVDDGELLTAAQEAAIAQRLDEVAEKHQLDLVVVTEKTLGGKNKVAFADDFFDYYG